MVSYHLSRRSLLVGAAAGTATLSLTRGALAGAVQQGVRVTLPAPTGPFPIGTVPVHLVDRSRPDPWMASVPQRELMISVWYPALGASSGRGLARYMEPGVAERWDAQSPHRIPEGTVDWAAIRTHACLGGPVDRRAGRCPVVLYSPGSADPRTWSTFLVEELASRGYIVITIDHTYESPAVRFPDGTVRTNDVLLEEFRRAQADGTVTVLLEKMLHTRVADARFVLDRLSALPGGLSRMADIGRVGMAGQSGGGFTAAQAMYEDPRVRAGIDMDGTLEFNQEPNGTRLSPVALHGLDRPFVLMGRDGSDHTTEPSWAAFWSHATGWRRDLTPRGSRHQTYTDLTAIMPQTGLPPETIEHGIGTINAARAMTAIRAYTVSFFDRWLRHHDDHLLDGPSPRYPEVAFVS
jgi:hypothetical protein